MFQKQVKQQPIYLQKKKLFHQNIRKKDRQNLINRLRKRAQMPSHIQEMLINLSSCIKELINKIVNFELREWQQVIAEQIINSKEGRLRELFDTQSLQQTELISLFIFLLNKSNQEQSLYKQYFHNILQRSKSWTYLNRMHLFLVFNFMLKKGYSFVLQDAEAFHSTLNSNRFFDSQLYFYDLILRKYPSAHNIKIYLAHQTLKRISEQIQSHFYSEQQRIKMIQILIQILYVSQEQEISKYLDIPNLFTRLEYLIGYSNKNKSIVDRSILLIYNINIDATSKSFVNHNCFKVITAQMKNKEHHSQIRLLLAELYLNCILNYPGETYYSFLKSNIQSILEQYEYILEEFDYHKQMHEFVVELLTSILRRLEEQAKEECPVVNSIKGHRSLLGRLGKIEKCELILQKFNITAV